MLPPIRLLLAVGFAAPALSAQVPPGSFAPPELDTMFTPANLSTVGLYRNGATNKTITQINFTKSPGLDTAGEYTVALTVHDLVPAYGGSNSGGEFVVMGKYDTTVTPHTFFPNAQAKAMNDPNNGPCRTLMIEPKDGICCTVDQKDGIYFSIRTSVQTSFPTPVKVTTATGTAPLPSGSYFDASPCFIDGTLSMIYTDKTKNIIARELVPIWNGQNLGGAELQKAVVIATTQRPPHSPTPIIDLNGDVQGLWLATGDANDSDMYFQAGLTAKDEAMEMFGGTNWKGRGGVCSGRLFFVSNGAVYFGRAAWILGSNTPIGGMATAVICAHNPRPPVASFLTYLAVSAKWNNGVHAGVPIPGFNGKYALEDPMVQFYTAFSASFDDIVFWQTPVPNDPTIVGIRLSFQGLATPRNQVPTLTNTATFEFK